jgi:disulfide bond formation protein DsbB
LHQGSPGMAGTPETNSGFGNALAAGDFNRDGFGDLAIGQPFATIGAVPAGGQIHVLYGSASGLTTNGNQIFHQDYPEVEDVAEDFDNFGQHLAAGNFGGSPHTDLAIGVAGEDAGGAVSILYGSITGLTTNGDQLWQQGAAGLLDSDEAGDSFGSSLAAANFGKSSHDDLAIGVATEDVDTVVGAGAVAVLYGSSGGLTAAGNQFWTQDTPNILDTSEPDDGVAETGDSSDTMGFSVAAANLGKSSHADLAIGVPGEDVGATMDAGAVAVLYGSTTGLSPTGNQLWHQDRPGIVDVAESTDFAAATANPDFFGYFLSAGNLGKSTHADLVIGVVAEDVGAVEDAGAVAIIYGSSTGLVSTGNQFWHQNSSGILDTAEAKGAGINPDFFGFASSVVNVGKTAQADLVVGVPGEDIGTVTDAGATAVLYGGTGGVTATGDELWHQDSPGVPDSVEADDLLGARITGVRRPSSGGAGGLLRLP